MKRRIVASIVGVAAVALLLLGVPLGLAVERLYQNEEILKLEREANEAQRHVDITTIEPNHPFDARAEDGSRLGIYDLKGSRVAGSGPVRGDDVVRRALSGDVHDMRSAQKLAVAIPITQKGVLVGAVRATKPASVVRDRTRRAWLMIALIAVGALFIAALLAWWQARRLTRPVDALVDSARKLGNGDFAVRTTTSGIEELDDVGRALDRTAVRLSDLVARERAFSADASHQLRTPIAALRVRVESALTGPDAQLRPALEDTLVPIDRLETTVEDLLALARDTHMDRSPLDVNDVVREAEAAWHGKFAAAGRPFHTDYATDAETPMVAKPAVDQIVDVLLSNAYEHGAGAVTMQVRRGPGAVVIDVGDEGNDHLDGGRIFDRRVGQSTGIGLALARTLAEAEGARLLLERPGPCPVFRLVLPVDGRS